MKLFANLLKFYTSKWLNTKLRHSCYPLLGRMECSEDAIAHLRGNNELHLITNKINSLVTLSNIRLQ